MEVEIDPGKRGVGRTVLVVDDNPAIRKLLATAFMSEGFKTCEAENGTEAVELAQKSKPDVITMDLSMPGIKRRWARIFHNTLAPNFVPCG